MATGDGYGEIPGVAVGTTFESRAALSAAKVHRETQAGITGTGRRGAESIVISGGYEDDLDEGDKVIYTGHGGNDRNTGRQIANQSVDARGNAALITSALTGAPVRVVRGAHRGSEYAPQRGLRYDGLYRVTDWWTGTGKSGYTVCKFHLVSLTLDWSIPSMAIEVDYDSAAPHGNHTPGRSTSTVQRVIRSTEVADFVKTAHDHTCQVCRIRLTILDRGYSEGAHIRALGRPHHGPDVPGNVLCLCPNCHVLFDNGVILIGNDLRVVAGPDATVGAYLRTVKKHTIEPDYLVYHRSIHVITRSGDRTHD